MPVDSLELETCSFTVQGSTFEVTELTASSYRLRSKMSDDFAVVRSIIEDKLHQEFYNVPTKDLPPRMQPRQLPNLQDAMKIDWDDWKSWEWMQPGWKGVKMHSQCVINADGSAEIRSAACGSETHAGVMHINQPAAKSSLWAKVTFTGCVAEHLYLVLTEERQQMENDSFPAQRRDQQACQVFRSEHVEEIEEKVALKKIEGVFEHITIAKRTLRELRILRHLQHENLMQVKNIFMVGSRYTFQELYVVSELMETDLASTLRSSQMLTDDHCQFFLYQILRGMKYVHSAQVIHRDLKPRNLLVNSNCDLKVANLVHYIATLHYVLQVFTRMALSEVQRNLLRLAQICDFGLARVRFSDKEWVCPMTECALGTSVRVGIVLQRLRQSCDDSSGSRHCQTMGLTGKVLCSWTDYSCESIGCILAEMSTRRPLFPGQSTQNQLDMIIDLLGSPDSQELMKIPNEKCRKFIKSLPVHATKSFPEVFKSMPEPAVDILRKMLRWDPLSRLSVEEAIAHPYLDKLHCPEDEPTREPLDTTDFEFERRKITLPALREEIFREALEHFPEVKERFDQEIRSGNEKPHDILQYRLLLPGESQYSSDEESGEDI
ncbi:MPK14 [Symbiodinium necroappetens]|uniref:MPK14 protein n=1 Tax=Symbiodinium necroappetens TaxID=1628268 RepID=A0A812QBJ0_9DINO|nr:MPK14 [Symbiodinium necroappetens]